MTSIHPSPFEASPTPEPGLPLDAQTQERLARIARARGITVAEALREALQAGTGQLERDHSLRQQLTPKQQQVLDCLKSGLSVKESAARLGVSEETVRTHILRIRSRLDCSDLLSLRFQ
jgi:DNA-binding NarL/FixJ family response regulator